MIRVHDLARLLRTPAARAAAARRAAAAPPVSRRLVRRRVRRRAAAGARAAPPLHGRGPRRLPHPQRRRASRRAVLPASRRAPRPRRLGRGRGHRLPVPPLRLRHRRHVRAHRLRHETAGRAARRSARRARSTARSSCGTTPAARRPTWEVPRQPTEGFPAPFRQVSTIVDHPQDIVENAVDIGHIGPLHGYRNARVRRPFARRRAVVHDRRVGAARVPARRARRDRLRHRRARARPHLGRRDDPAAATPPRCSRRWRRRSIRCASRSASASRCASGKVPRTRVRSCCCRAC